MGMRRGKPQGVGERLGCLCQGRPGGRRQEQTGDHQTHAPHTTRFGVAHAGTHPLHPAHSLPVGAFRVRGPRQVARRGGRAEERCLRLEDHRHGDPFQERSHRALVQERLEEATPAERRQDSGRDAAAEIHPGSRQRAQGQVAGGGAQRGHKQLEGIATRRAAPLERGRGDCRRTLVSLVGQRPTPTRGRSVGLPEVHKWKVIGHFEFYNPKSY